MPLMFCICDQTATGDNSRQAILDAAVELHTGAPRKLTIKNLQNALKEKANQQHRQQIENLIRDLRLAQQRSDSLPFGRDYYKNPDRYLIESRLGLGVYQYNNKPPARSRNGPDDPCVMLVNRGRNVIPLLIPLLNDQAVTRSSFTLGSTKSKPRMRRVCDLAIVLIEHLTLCDFQPNNDGQLLHQRPEGARKYVKTRISNWWKENKDGSVAEGIKSQLRFADFHGRIRMAGNLIRLARDGAAPPSDEPFGLEYLRDMRDEAGYLKASVNRALEKWGDKTWMRDSRQLLEKEMVTPGRILDRGTVKLLAEHGGRDEWEFLQRLSRFEDKRDPRMYQRVTDRAILSAGRDGSLWAIPSIAMLLEKSLTEKREFHQVSPSATHRAIDTFQKLTGRDFGFSYRLPLKEREATVQRAVKWWQETGSAEYTLDKIEQLIKQRQPQN